MQSQYEPAEKPRPRKGLLLLVSISLVGLVCFACIGQDLRSDEKLGMPIATTELALDPELGEDDERNLEILEQAFLIEAELSRAQSSTRRTRELIAQKLDETREFFEGEIQSLKAGKKPNLKGSLAGTTKATATLLGQSEASIGDLTPQSIQTAVRFIRSNFKLLEENNIPLIANIEHLEDINHRYLITVMDFGAVIQAIHEKNRISAKYMKYLTRKKYQKGKRVKQLFKYVFKSQIKMMQRSLERITKIEQTMTALSNKMQTQVSRISSATSRVQGVLDAKILKLRRALVEQEGTLQFAMDEIKRTIKEKGITFHLQVIPTVVTDTRKLSCNAKKIVTPAQFQTRCKYKTEKKANQYCGGYWVTYCARWRCDKSKTMDAVLQDCDTKTAEFNNRRDKNNYDRQVAYNRNIAMAQNALNRKLEGQEAAKIRKLEALFNIQNNANKQKRRIEDERERNIALTTKWAMYMGRIEAHAARVQKSADQLLYVVKIYKEKVIASIDELRSVSADNDWFQGIKSGGLEWGDPKELTTLENEEELSGEGLVQLGGDPFKDGLTRDMEKFEEEADDLDFTLFATSVWDEMDKINTDSVKALAGVKERVNNWGNPLAA